MGKDLEGNGSGQILRCYTDILFCQSEENHVKPFRIVGIPAEIRSEHPPPPKYKSRTRSVKWMLRMHGIKHSLLHKCSFFPKAARNIISAVISEYSTWNHSTHFAVSTWRRYFENFS
jgi:hypothetical protein